MLSAQNDTIRVHGSVTTVPAMGLISKPANLLDLEGTTVTFTPDGADAYTVAVGPLTWEDPGGARAQAFSEPARRRPSPFDDRSRLRTASDVRREDSVVDLPFSFPFAGRTWTRIYANVNGNISFQQSEQMQWPHRDPWPDATMRSVAAAIDSRSAAGLETMIAALWAIYGDTTISVDATPARAVITWQAVRPTPFNVYYEPLGENVFQARLYPSGAIELAYRPVAERDGI